MLRRNSKTCGHCEVKLTESRRDRTFEVEEIELIKCGLCGSATSFISGVQRSVTTTEGEQRDINPITEL